MSGPSEASDTGASSEPELIELADQAAWERWLERNHAQVQAVWLKLAKQGAPHTTVAQAEAVESALCFGWIDGQVGRVDGHYYRQRFTPRRPRSRWSAKNTQWAEALIAAGRMRPAGLAQVQAARDDGRWDAAYSQANDALPVDLAAAIDAEPRARAFLATLSSQNRFAMIFRLGAITAPETRARRITEYVAMLARGETLH